MTLVQLTDRITQLVRGSGDHDSILVSAEVWRHNSDPGDPASFKYRSWTSSDNSSLEAGTPSALLLLVEDKYCPAMSGASEDVELPG
jgi:hypothetical protein